MENGVFSENANRNPTPKFFFPKFWKKSFPLFHQIFDLWRHFGPKNELFWPFSTKMTYFDQIDPINDIFDQSYVNKPDWHNVFKFLE